ncbi:hypothetical protein RZS08_08635, partial [Arthrospira platensis SPKY1]|nr:hypothetical protein [Arthrospira platensis SPKY1]
MHTNNIHTVFWTLGLLFCTYFGKAQEIPNKVPDQLKVSDSLVQMPLVQTKPEFISERDSTKKDSIIPPKKAILEGKARTKATDYRRIDQNKKTITLYNEAELYYLDLELKAGIIVYDYEKNEV